MASIQDIHALEEQIYDAVQEYLDNPDGYENATLHVYLDEDEMEYQAEIDDNLSGTEDDGIYPIESLIREGDNGREPDNDRACDIANSWIFLDSRQPLKSINDQNERGKRDTAAQAYR